MENYELQPDGRMVAGPPLPSNQPKPKSKLRFILIGIWILSVIGMFFLGQSLNKNGSGSIHEQIVNRLQAGCVFQFKGISTTDLGREDLEQQAKGAVEILEKESGVKNISSSSVPAQDGVRRMDPTATRLVVVSWEVCK